MVICLFLAVLSPPAFSAGEVREISISCKADLVRLTGIPFHTATGDLMASLTPRGMRTKLEDGRLDMIGAARVPGKKQSIEFPVTEEEKAAVIELAYSLLPSDSPIQPAPIEELRAKAKAANAPVYNAYFLSSTAYSHQENATSPAGGILTLPYRTPYGDIPMFVPVLSSYERMMPQNARQGRGMMKLGHQEVTPENMVSTYYRAGLVGTEALRRDYAKNGYVFVFGANYEIKVSDNKVSGRVESLESYSRQIARGLIDESKSELLAHEKLAADILAEEGGQVTALAASRENKVRMADVSVIPHEETEPIKIEIKSPTDDESGLVDGSTIKNRVWNSLKGGGQAQHLLIDARKSNLTMEEAQRGAFRLAGLLKEPDKSRYRERLKSVRIIGLENGARFDLRFNFLPE